MNAYIARKGDSLFELAERFGVNLRALVMMNPHVHNPGDIEPGTKIFIPPAHYPYAVHPFAMSNTPAYPVMAFPYAYPNQPSTQPVSRKKKLKNEETEK